MDEEDHPSTTAPMTSNKEVDEMKLHACMTALLLSLAATMSVADDAKKTPIPPAAVKAEPALAPAPAQPAAATKPAPSESAMTRTDVERVDTVGGCDAGCGCGKVRVHWSWCKCPLPWTVVSKPCKQPYLVKTVYCCQKKACK